VTLPRFFSHTQFDQVEAVIAQTKANLHRQNILADLAEEFGLRRPPERHTERRQRSDAERGRTEIHALSQVFTGAIYDIR
jgi:hypothetical protein